MFNSMERFAELYNKLGSKTILHKNILWSVYKHMVVPVGPAKMDYSITKSDADFLLKKFPFAILLRTTRGFERFKYNKNNNLIWYNVICDKNLNLGQMTSKNRYKMKRGLKSFSIGRIDAKFLSHHGYDIYKKAFGRYRNVTSLPVGHEQFKKTYLSTTGFDDIVHHWGVFFENKLVGFSTFHLYDTIEAFALIRMTDPGYLRLCPTAAFEYTIRQYYVDELKFEYINRGCKNLAHDTANQEVLVKDFEYRKEFCGLNIVYNKYAGTILKLSFPFRKLIGKLNGNLRALYTMEELHRNQICIE